MKNPVKPQIIPYVTLCCGILGLVLQIIFFATRVDEKGLLVTGGVADTLSWFLVAIVMAVLALGIRGLGGTPRYERLFPASVLGAAGNCLGAVGIAAASIQMLLSGSSSFSTLAVIAGFAAVLCLSALAYCRWKGQKPRVLLRIPVLLFLALHALSLYQGWRAATQLQEFIFPLFASVFLILACFHRATLEAKLDGRRSYVFFNQAAAFFCLLAAAQDMVYYLAMAVWMYADVCSLRVMHKRPRPQRPEMPEEG